MKVCNNVIVIIVIEIIKNEDANTKPDFVTWIATCIHAELKNTQLKAIMKKVQENLKHGNRLSLLFSSLHSKYLVGDILNAPTKIGWSAVIVKILP
jgi:hypothetical protein